MARKSVNRAHRDALASGHLFAVDGCMKSNRAQAGCSPARILLAEDDSDLRMLFALKLEDAGFEVTQACDGRELLERLIDSAPEGGNSTPFDIILSDINMPHFNPLDVIIGARSRLTTTPIVLMTSFADAQTREQARRLGVREVLDKPLRLDDLSATILRILADWRRQPAELH
ncbi:MAG: putative two-component response regulator [Polyangiaceae bacterium]|jgi:CheY-like chemotaxis protein|nr:putative two-component response regulator [Polyangiaceae bacterium]